MSENRPTMICPNCKEAIPAGSELCPKCGKKIRPRLGSLTDEQIKGFKRPLTIIAWIVVIILLYFKFFR